MIRLITYLSLLLLSINPMGITPPMGDIGGFSNEEIYVYLNNVDNPVSIDQIQLEIQVSDDHDGDLTSDIYVVTDNYTPNIDVLGDHLIVFGITDSGGAESTLAITVRNLDVTAPELIVDVESSLNIPQYSHLASNLPRIIAIDGFEGDITSEISITGLELIDTEVLGNHTLIYTVSDSSGNQTIEEFIVSVVDSIPPTIDGPTEIIKRKDTILDGQFYLQYFSAEDDHDSIVTNRIEVISDAYTGNANNPGRYQVIVSVADTQGNYTNHTLYIVVVNEMIPRLIIDKYYWVVESNQLVNDMEFISILQDINDLPNYTYVFTTTYDNYTNFYQSFNTYAKSFSLLSSSGEEFDRDIVLEVVAGDMNVIAEQPGIIEANSKTIIAIFATIGVLGLFAIGLIKSGKK